jgi:hypothetical protein
MSGLQPHVSRRIVICDDGRVRIEVDRDAFEALAASIWRGLRNLEARYGRVQPGLIIPAAREDDDAATGDSPTGGRCLTLAARKPRNLVATSDVPLCPKCLDAGSVQMVEFTFDATTIFSPLPPGRENNVVHREFRCGCGWTTPVLPGQSRQPDPQEGETL